MVSEQPHLQYHEILRRGCRDTSFGASSGRPHAHRLLQYRRGIPTEECEKVFDKFYRSISTGHQQVKGFGLGLAVVHRFAGLIGANVHFDSCPEEPTTVSVVI